MILNIFKLTMWIMLLYVSTTVFTPKIDFGIATIYLFEPFFLLVLSYFLIKKKIVIRTMIEKSYLIYMAISALSYPIGVYLTGEMDTVYSIMIVKYSMYGFIISIAYLIANRIGEHAISNILISQFTFVLLAGLYVTYNLIAHPVSLGSMIWDYSKEYRLIGLTGQSFGLDGLKAVGNTSVQMGVYVGFLFLIFLSLYIHTFKRFYGWIALILFSSEMLTQSRSGLVVVFVGLAYIIFDKFYNKKIINLVVVFIIILSVGSIYFDLFNILTSFGSLGKVFNLDGFQDSSAQKRVTYVIWALQYIATHPLAIFFGTGYGEFYTYTLIGTPHLESLILTTLFQSGIFAFMFLVAHFYLIWFYARKYSNHIGNNYFRTILYGYKLYIPGLFVANAVGGNSLQTDFLAPLFYFVLGICIIKIKEEEKQDVKSIKYISNS